MLTAVDNCLAAIDRQIRKNKTKLSKRLRDSGFDDYIALEGQPEKVEEETEFKIIKRKSFSAKPMMVEEAILQMNMLGHTFFIFTNPDTMSPNIVYKRKHGFSAGTEITTEAKMNSSKHAIPYIPSQILFSQKNGFCAVCGCPICKKSHHRLGKKLH